MELFCFKMPLRVFLLLCVLDLSLGQAPESVQDQLWWQHAIVYQIYPRSLQDTDNDGTGDLKGELNLCSLDPQKLYYFNMNSVTRRPDCVFNIWPFSAMKICPKAYKLYQSELKTLPKTKKTLNMLSNIFKYWSKWWNFARSVHSDKTHVI